MGRSAQTVHQLLKLSEYVQEIHQPGRQKQHNNLGQSNSLPIVNTLPHQYGRFVYFGLVRSHNQLCTSHTLINLLVTNLFYIHARNRMIEVARRNEN